MEKRLLQRGDVIRIKKGMKVYAKIPEMFVFSNRRESTGIVRHDIKIGEVRYSKFQISNDIKETLKRNGLEINDEQIAYFNGLGTTLSFDTNKFEGEYTVYYAGSDGGGSGMGHFDTYPNGHHVFCEKNDDSGIEIDFYQTGSFTAMIRPEEIEPI